MVGGLLVLLACQLVGELAVRLLDVAVPGPVVGMVVLLAWLQVRRPGPDAGVVRAAAGLLQHLPLLFVPAGVGVVQYLTVLGASAVPLLLGLLVSWAAALVATAATVAALLAVSARLATRSGTSADAVRPRRRRR